MTIQLYYAPRSRAGRIRWLLEELGVEHELVRVDLAVDRSAEHLAIHPLGKVPALRDGDLEMIESGAMCVYLADKFADRGLAPTLDAPERAAYLQWIFYTSNTLEPPLLDLWRAGAGRAEAERDVAAMAAAGDAFERVVAVVERAVDGREYLVGETFSAADIMIGSVLAWAKAFGLLEGYPGLAAYGKRIGSRPAARRARAD